MSAVMESSLGLRTRFVEGDMTIFSDASQEQFDASSSLDGLLIGSALAIKVRVVPI